MARYHVTIVIVMTSFLSLLSHRRIVRLSSLSLLCVAAVACAGSNSSGAPSAAAAAATSDTSEDDLRGEGGLTFGFPDQEGVDATKLMDLTSFIGDSQRRVFSIVVSKNGRVIYELYTSSLTRADAHYVMSVTKSFTSALMGIAIGQGLVGGANETVADALPAKLFPNAAQRDRFRTVTVRDVLGMSALDAEVPPHRNLPEDVTRGHDFFAAENRAAFALTQSLLPSPGASFQYTDITPLIATGIITYASQMTTFDFANQNLFLPLGFKNQEWMHEDQEGLDNGAYGLRMRPIDMQKFGMLYMNGGTWQNKQIVPADWVAKSFTPWIKTTATMPNPNYGWYWWTYDFGPGWTARVANGWKGQRIAVIPEQNVVVTMTGNVTDDEEGFFAQVVQQYVMPAVANANGNHDTSLRQPLRQAIEGVRTGAPRFDGIEARMIPSVWPKETHHGFLNSEL